MPIVQMRGTVGVLRNRPFPTCKTSGHSIGAIIVNSRKAHKRKKDMRGSIALLFIVVDGAAASAAVAALVDGDAATMGKGSALRHPSRLVHRVMKSDVAVPGGTTTGSDKGGNSSLNKDKGKNDNEKPPVVDNIALSPPTNEPSSLQMMTDVPTTAPQAFVSFITYAPVLPPTAAVTAPTVVGSGSNSTPNPPVLSTNITSPTTPIEIVAPSSSPSITISDVNETTTNATLVPESSNTTLNDTIPTGTDAGSSNNDTGRESSTSTSTSTSLNDTSLRSSSSDNLWLWLVVAAGGIVASVTASLLLFRRRHHYVQTAKRSAAAHKLHERQEQALPPQPRFVMVDLNASTDSVETSVSPAARTISQDDKSLDNNTLHSHRSVL